MIGALNEKDRCVTVIGGGIAGLLAAYFLDKKGYEVTLFEASDRFGGLIRTETTPWGIAEAAAHSLLTTPAVKELFEELQIEAVSVNRDSKSRYILRKGKLRKFPLSILEAAAAFLRAYFVLADKKKPSEGMTMAEWARRFLGDSALQYLITPMVRGIYGVRPEDVSVGAAFPALAVPRGHSLLSFFLHKQLRKKSGKSSGMVTPRAGMGEVVQQLERKLKERLGDRLVRGVRVSELPFQGNVILAVDAISAGTLLEDHDSVLAKALSEVQYTPLVSVTVFAEAEKFEKVPNGVGVLVPEGEKSQILGVLFNSSSFPNRVNDPKWVSVSVMLGAAFLELDEVELISRVRQELSSLFGLKGELSGYQIYRWKRAIPKYNWELVGTWDLAKAGWCSKPGHILFGNYTGQVSLRGMIESAGAWL